MKKEIMCVVGHNVMENYLFSQVILTCINQREKLKIKT